MFLRPVFYTFEGLMSIPHGNADTERMFSHLNNMKTAQRSQMSDGTLKSCLIVKLNNDTDCYTFEPSAEMIKDARTATMQLLSESRSNRLLYTLVLRAMMITSQCVKEKYQDIWKRICVFKSVLY